MKKTFASPATLSLASQRRGTSLAWVALFVSASFTAGWRLGSRPPFANQATAAMALQQPVRRLPEGPRPADPVLRHNEEEFEQIMHSALSDSARLEQLGKFVNGLDVPSTRAMIAYLQRVSTAPEDYVRMTARLLLVSHWTTLDPAGALAWVREMPKASDRIEAFEWVLEAWGNHDTAPLLATMEELGRLGNRHDLLGTVLGKVAETNPLAAFNYLNHVPASLRQPSDYFEIFDHWARLAPESAASAALNMPAGQARKLALTRVASEWGDQDPQAAMSWATSQTEGKLRNDLVDTVLEGMSYADPAAAIRILETMPISDLGWNAITAVVNNWAKRDPQAALLWAQNAGLPPQLLRDTLSGVFSSMAQSDPAGAAEAVAGITNGTMRQESLNSVARTWALEDPAAAMAWMESLPANGRNRQPGIAGTILSTWAEQDPAAAAAYLTEHGMDVDTLGGSVPTIARVWGERDPNAALAWAANLPSGDSQVAAMREILSQQIDDAPDATWNFLKQLPSDSERYQELRFSMLEEIARADPAKSVSYWEQLPEEAQKNSVAQIVSAWSEKNPATTAQWINTLPAGATRDNAVSQLIASQGEFEPEQAFAWAATIGDANQRQGRLLEIARQLYLEDPALAESTIQAANLPNDQAEQLRRYAQSDPSKDNNQRDELLTDFPGDEISPLDEVSARPDDYTVQRGDTLSAIARRLGVDLEELIQANAVADPRTLHIGQKLTVPGQPPARVDSRPPSGVYTW